MATITETYIHPEVFRPTKKATYTISGITESDLHADLQATINAIPATPAEASGPFIFGGMDSSLTIDAVQTGWVLTSADI